MNGTVSIAERRTGDGATGRPDRPRRALLKCAGAAAAGLAGLAGLAIGPGVVRAHTAGAQPAGHPWLPGSRRIGQATLRAFGFAAYDAALFALADFDGPAYAQHPLVLEIRYRRSFAGADIAEYSLQEMRRQGDLDEASAQRWLRFMRRAFPDVRPGDRLTGHWNAAAAASRFGANDAAPTELVDPAFGPRFFGIWLAPRTSRPDVRDGLLGVKRSGQAP